MKAKEDYIEVNKSSWNKRTEAHLESDFYDVEGFVKGKNPLNSIELDLLGDVSGKKILHLQCHFGQDSIQLSRMGADVVGVDLSDEAIKSGEELAIECGQNTKFICCDLFDLPNHLNEKFDIVFTSYGTIGWLPDIEKWASIVGKFLKAGGRFVMADFHPTLWMFDDDFEKVKYNYFNSEPIVETEQGTYADKEAEFEKTCITWNHSISSILSGLMDNGIGIEKFQEFDYSPYDCFSGTVKIEDRKYRIEKMGDKLPMVYAILGVKN